MTEQEIREYICVRFPQENRNLIKLVTFLSIFGKKNL